ncbi:pantetheine-phosphate adenylyltransferase [Yeguia hominis]|uniref:Phosphopantetheine adenylyltransferase n=1 Tax=Yeguia hominis TaxID=2763662 RepID=A0A926HQP6_9FIRM|nr:pantetheine-phosphate adenylyltransferase [Yeguia hominis]MBC8532954.1 pantetheine-phosphate adenylyltransferase [Yeguia hominis]
MKTAIYPGSFDPVTLGHLDIIQRACKVFDELVVAVLVNPEKHTAFSIEERLAFLKRATAEIGIQNISFVGFEGLLADYAHRCGIHIIVKGLRALSDFEYEFQMALTNRKLNPDLETMFFTTSAENMYLSSSMVKQIAGFDGDISNFVPECILSDLKKRLYTGGRLG